MCFNYFCLCSSRWLGESRAHLVLFFALLTRFYFQTSRSTLRYVPAQWFRLSLGRILMCSSERARWTAGRAAATEGQRFAAFRHERAEPADACVCGAATIDIARHRATTTTSRIQKGHAGPQLALQRLKARVLLHSGMSVLNRGRMCLRRGNH